MRAAPDKGATGSRLKTDALAAIQRDKVGVGLSINWELGQV
ncbi:hypothetical protein COLO4_02763 [Corchorus olitorius]|uniref:Uncharacterized protein n=1 Tax=Corchorus olitorius TaxID=93759 RepID=A0A1R3L0A7_9ROSI|nr:hypothetical protein COLO4_02763 [Corchorus olitorius]